MLGGEVLAATLSLEMPSGIFQEKFLLPGHHQVCRFPSDYTKAGRETRQDSSWSHLSQVLPEQQDTVCHKHRGVVYEMSLNLQAAIVIPEQGEEMERGCGPARNWLDYFLDCFPPCGYPYLHLEAGVCCVFVRAGGCVKCSGKVRNLILPPI